MIRRIGVVWLTRDLEELARRLSECGDFKFEIVESVEDYLEINTTFHFEECDNGDNIPSYLHFNGDDSFIPDVPILVLDDDLEGQCLAVDSLEPFTKETSQLIALYAYELNNYHYYYKRANPRMFGLRFGDLPQDKTYLELTRLDCTTNETLEEASDMAKAAGMHATVVEYPIEGGFYERIRIPLELESLRLVRHLNNPPVLVDHLTKTALNLPNGVLSVVRDIQPRFRGDTHDSMDQLAEQDSRFRSAAGYFPYEDSSPFWKSLDSDGPSPVDPMDVDIPVEGNVLIVGAPQLVEGWKKTLFEQSGGKVNAVTWPLWDLGEVSEESVAPILKQGPYRLIIECLVSAVEDRQSLLDALLPSLMPRGMIWAHTLNAAATVTVQVVPEDTCAIGFGGLPPTDNSGSVELMCPASSKRHDLQRAAAMALHLGLTPYEVPDEPGGIGARTLAVLVNSTLFTVREGIVATPTEADAAAKALFNMQESPLQIADQVGLDVIEAVLLGLKALLGEERYRVCPLITMRIESGATGHASGKGFYAK